MSNPVRTVPAWWLAFLFAILSIALVLAPARALAEEPARTPIDLPVVVRGEGVVVRAEAGLDELARRVAERAPEQLAKVSRDLEGLPMPGAIELRLVKRTEDLTRAAPGMRRVPEWARGVAFSDVNVAVVATRRAHESIDAVRVAEHELTHLALGAALRGRAPRWLDEGFAFVHAAEDSPARTQILVGMAWTGDTATLSELERMFRGSAVTVDRAYAQSYDLVAFLTRRGRYPDAHDNGDRWPFRRFLAEIAAGADADQAARTAYGAPLGQLFGEWHEDLRQRYLLIPASLFMLGVWVVAAILLVIGAARRRVIKRSILERWEREEAARSAAHPPWPPASETRATELGRDGATLPG